MATKRNKPPTTAFQSPKLLENRFIRSVLLMLLCIAAVLVWYGAQNTSEHDPAEAATAEQLLTEAADANIAGAPQKANKLAKQAGELGRSIGDVSIQVQATLLEIETNFATGNRATALQQLKRLTKDTDSPVHIINQTPKSKATLNEGLARILAKNNLLSESRAKGVLAVQDFNNSGAHKRAADTAVELAVLYEKKKNAAYAAEFYSLASGAYQQARLPTTALKLYEKSADLLVSTAPKQAFFAYMELMSRYYNHKELSQDQRDYQRDRLSKKIADLPPEATVMHGDYDVDAFDRNKNRVKAPPQ